MESIVSIQQTAVIPTTSEPILEDEQKLTNQIIELWSVHVEGQSVLRRTKDELVAVRRRLAESLHMMKQILARPGRGGQWSSFLTERGIARTTADRLVAGHTKSRNANGNGTSGAISELTDEEIAELAKAVWSKLRKKLGNDRAAYVFLGRLAAESGLTNFKFTRGDQRGLAVADPDASAASPAGATMGA